MAALFKIRKFRVFRVVFAGVQVDRPALAALFRAYDPSRGGALQHPQFLALSMALQSSRRIFATFDPQSSGAITLIFNQFV